MIFFRSKLFLFLSLCMGVNLYSADPAPDDGYTINYNTISMVEYLRFAGKVCGTNFIFDEAELDFTVSVLSDAPITAENVMATLVQVLRIHGLMLLEQGNSLVIHKSGDVRQVAKLVTETGQGKGVPIVTRIFRLRNAQAGSIAGIIQPMISSSAILETSPETRQLILTDVTANVDKIAGLIEILDSPHTPLDISTYSAVHNNPEYLLSMAGQIMAPIAQGNPFILVPQPLANSIVIVSTPELIERATSILKLLDVEPIQGLNFQKQLKGENIFVYKIEYRKGSSILQGLQDVVSGLIKSGIPEGDLIETIESGRWMEASNSLMFVGSKDSIAKVKEFVTALDVPTKEESVKANFFIYRPQHKTAEEIQKSILEMAQNLKGAKGADPALLSLIESAKINPLTHTLSFSGEERVFPQVKELLTTIDIPTGKSAPTKNNFYLYKIQRGQETDIENGLKNLAKQLDSSNASDEPLISTIKGMKYIPESHSLLFTGPEPTLKRVADLVPDFDVAHRETPKNNFYLYKIQRGQEEDVEKGLKNFSSKLSDSDAGDESLKQSIKTMKYIPETHSFLFTGPETTLKRIADLLPEFDTGNRATASDQFLTYKPKYVKGEQLAESLKEIESNLHVDKYTNPAFLQALQSMRWVKTTNSFLFTGSSGALQKVSELISTIDVASSAAPVVEKNFFLYRPQHASRQKTEEYLNQLSSHLDKKGDKDLINTIKSAKWVDPSQSFMFQGPEASLKRLKDLLQNFDTPEPTRLAGAGFYIYPLEYISQEKADQYLNQVAEHLQKKGSDPELVETIISRKWIEDSHSFMFQGTEGAISQVKELMKNYDTQAEAGKRGKSGYFLYKVQNTNGEAIEEDLDNLAKNFKSSGYKDPEILKVIEGIRYVKETNSLLLTGDPKAIEEVKAIIADYDYPRQTKGPIHSNFLLYKPQYISGKQIEKSLDEISQNLKKAGLADPGLLTAISSAKYVDTTNSLVFTGPPESLQKIETLIKDIDIPPEKHAPIQHMGQTTFLLYKLKHASGPQIITAIKSMTANLKKIGSSDKEFINALQSVKYVKETNSLLFTGTEPALNKVQPFVEQFDVTGLGDASIPITPPPPGGPSNFFVYKPQSLAGPELEKILVDFAENLKMSGLSDPDLFQTISSMRYIDKTQSLVFTGSPKALNQIKDLLKEFDIPANLPEGVVPGGAEPSIQAIDNTSFLVYKLQFHKGDEIQNALRQIAKDLILSNAPVNQNLLNSINSIQWLEVTNSLLCSGDQETLTRLRELIKNLDIPLKQVFIEMLVIETNLSNTLNFGLEWGANYKYRDKFGGSMFNTLPGSQSDSFVTNLSRLTPPTPPTPIGNLPPQSGFDLGVIGEIIKHNGNTFLTLGSLLTALQTDNETSVLMTPKILTQDGRTSSIFVGQNIPFTGSFLTNSGSGTNIIQSANLEYRDIGLSLTVTPVLGNSDIVTLDIQLDRTQATNNTSTSTITIGSQTGTAPTTSRTSMQTTVHVPDRHFLILSGFANNTSSRSKAGIPCLGGLPLIGAAFSKSNDLADNTNIVIFLRPHIVASADEMRQLSRDQEEYFRDQTGTPYLEHRFNEGMELIKSVDDD